MKRIQLANYKAAHFGYAVSGKIATITLFTVDAGAAQTTSPGRGARSSPADRREIP